MSDEVEQERAWRAEMERIGPDTVRMRRTARMPITDHPPHPSPEFTDRWLREKERAARSREALGVRVVLFVAILAMVAAWIAAWPVLKDWWFVLK